MALSAVMLTKNSARRLHDVLAALAWCDEVIVYDTGSTDDTPAIAQTFANVRLHRHPGPFPGFGPARRLAIALARNAWILSIDSDEVVSSELAQELRTLQADARTVYAIPFHNYFKGRHITTCGWYPDRHERLFNREVTNFDASELHERVQTDGLALRQLRHPIRHYSYESYQDFLPKVQAYSRLFAQQHAGHRRSSPAKAIGRGAWAFVRSYVLQRGFMQGADGFVISAAQAQGAFWKYLFLHEANQGR